MSAGWQVVTEDDGRGPSARTGRLRVVTTVDRAWLAKRGHAYAQVLDRVGLPAWFFVIDLLWIVKPQVFAIDARHYQNAASVWLAGGDPWQVRELGVLYAAPPHTLLPYAVTSLLPFQVSVALWMIAGVAAGVWTVRRLGVPLWWIAFPPLFHAIWNGNPETLVLALLVLNHPLASAGALALKLYVGVQLLFRPKQLIIAGLIVGAATLILPWQQYLAAGVGEHLEGAWNGSAFRIPLLLIPTVLALVVLYRKGGEWWSIPAVWPATQFYYVATVMPAVTGRKVLAGLVALPLPLLVPIVVIGLAVRELWSMRHSTPIGRRVSPAPTPD